MESRVPLRTVRHDAFQAMLVHVLDKALGCHLLLRWSRQLVWGGWGARAGSCGYQRADVVMLWSCLPTLGLGGTCSLTVL